MNKFIRSIIAGWMVLSSSALMAGGLVKPIPDKPLPDKPGGGGTKNPIGYYRPGDKSEPGGRSKKWTKTQPDQPGGGRNNMRYTKSSDDYRRPGSKSGSN